MSSQGPARNGAGGRRLDGSTLGLIELLVVVGIVFGFGVQQLLSLRRISRKKDDSDER